MSAGPAGIGPNTNRDTTHYPTHYSSASVVHEFAHTIRHAADGDADHFNWDVIAYRYAHSHELCNSKNKLDIQSARDGFAFWNAGLLWVELVCGSRQSFAY